MPANLYDLHRAALDGDDDAVIHALKTGADINALDDQGRTPIMCAVAGDRWQEIDASDASFMTSKRLNAMRIMLRQSQISLYCLNAPHTATNGVIPLSMAAWLNFPNLVQVLLEESADAVAVDGLDAHGATALMYAARDNNLNVVQLLLSHGARPDLRDCNFRSSIQYAVTHPQILWLCESILRRHRWRESQSTGTVKLSVGVGEEASIEQLLTLARCALPSVDQTSSGIFIEPPPQPIFAPAPLSRSIKTLVSTLSNPPDTAFLQSVLFSPALPINARSSLYPLSVPILVNRPDERGWSLIHHACSFTFLSSPSNPSSLSGKMPEIQILDMLYLAGADISLFTVEEHYTPLHILAKTSTTLPKTITTIVKELIRDFVTHLVRDLDAPLGARDKDDETCLHLAAEYGANKVVLDILLDLDRVINDGRVSTMKNSRGYTPVELVINEELKGSFVVMKEKMEMATIRRGSAASASSALSGNTIRGSERDLSLTAVAVDDFGVKAPSSLISTPAAEEIFFDPADIDPEQKASTLLAHMRTHVPTQYTLDQMDTLVGVLVKHFQSKIKNARKEVDTAKRKKETVKANAFSLGAALCSHRRTRSGDSGCRNDDNEGERTVKGRKGKARESQDSQVTRVSTGSRDGSTTPTYKNISTQTAMGIGKNEFGTMKGQGWTEWFEGLIHVDEVTVKRKKEKKEKVKQVEGFGVSIGEFGSVERLKSEKEKERGEKGTVLGTHILKSWWKKMVTNDHPLSPTKSNGGKSKSNEKVSSTSLSYDIQDPATCAVGHEVKIPPPASTFSHSSLALAEDVGNTQVTVELQERSSSYLADLAEQQGEWVIGMALRTAPYVLSYARRDLERIEMGLRSAEEYLKNAETSVERVGRVLKRALKKRRAIMDEHLQSRTATPTPVSMRKTRPVSDSAVSLPDNWPSPHTTPGSPGHLGYTLSLSLRPSCASISSTASDCSSLSTATATNSPVAKAPSAIASGSLHGESWDDDETRTMRRLLLRRIEAQLRAAYDEVDGVVKWISIVQDVVGGVKRRTYL
ncbi:hypothetical protein AGABI1DRAFT_129835 [Agaricus bisporus var. burnettii JB137-S8]|uniref:protein S-acyltransferase n=1 Tax=Agaricus bisporus var. burnettii (strain JB137-S8 / ATCC MYA-4627 / FGSC 10392) TaxID=597362 RepID=K5X4G3_AGABU|nr:uncharacterized protein AGABI1DRAFT_129835 [Agaricus bisporus var. burnettii JB137-S8]EKM78058.1 hypothetical protein AGABI1DRAFT_129835 [Agaricus bisporus var. burnettii JB137-S8]